MTIAYSKTPLPKRWIYWMRQINFVFSLSLIGLVHHAFAASFDCSRAASTTEKLICSDAMTSALDGKLKQTYKTALAKASEEIDKRSLAQEQRNWIKYTRAICQDITCLQKAYSDRIAILARNEKNIQNDKSYCASPGGRKGNADDCGINAQVYRDPNSRIDSFNLSLVRQKQTGRIIACRRLIDLWDGAHIGPGRGEQTFGGYCVLQNGAQRQNVEICGDDMAGDFQMKQINRMDTSDKHLIAFTYNCSGI
jgi:uncharacterized protein